MEEARARELLSAERARLLQLLSDNNQAALDDRESADEEVAFDDGAEPLTAEAADYAIGTGIRDRLAALDRAEQRLTAGTFGRSIRSGRPIPDERLEADPAAELTVEEAAAE
jgi:RNA polymerase-binding transcription factor